MFFQRKPACLTAHTYFIGHTSSSAHGDNHCKRVIVTFVKILPVIIHNDTTGSVVRLQTTLREFGVRHLLRPPHGDNHCKRIIVTFVKILP
jgi:hypothetical protein